MLLVKSAWQAHCKNRKYQIVKRMPSMTTSVTCYTDRVMTRFLQAKKRQAQACEGRAGGESSLGAAAAPGR